jgi:hypothetical protein
MKIVGTLLCCSNSVAQMLTEPVDVKLATRSDNAEVTSSLLKGTETELSCWGTNGLLTVSDLILLNRVSSQHASFLDGLIRQEFRLFSMSSSTQSLHIFVNKSGVEQMRTKKKLEKYE